MIYTGWQDSSCSKGISTACCHCDGAGDSPLEIQAARIYCWCQRSRNRERKGQQIYLPSLDITQDSMNGGKLTKGDRVRRVWGLHQLYYSYCLSQLVAYANQSHEALLEGIRLVPRWTMRLALPRYPGFLFMMQRMNFRFFGTDVSFLITNTHAHFEIPESYQIKSNHIEVSKTWKYTTDMTSPIL